MCKRVHAARMCLGEGAIVRWLRFWTLYYCGPLCRVKGVIFGLVHVECASAFTHLECAGERMRLSDAPLLDPRVIFPSLGWHSSPPPRDRVPVEKWKLAERLTESLLGVRRELTKGTRGLSGVHRKFTEDIRSLLGVHRKLAEGGFDIHPKKIDSGHRWTLEKRTREWTYAKLSFKFSLEKIDQVSYELGYRVTLTRFRVKYPQLTIKEDPYATLSEDDNVLIEAEVPFDDSNPPTS
ncbi:hypothetical protein BHE74_00003793 [Ensete ventricosum]|nr:hypothetical protein GW17_00012260 [Ensete ventricosum]RWW87383.1 hypothetical protein BHE74_00003793 [Ensete ventricosum]